MKCKKLTLDESLLDDFDNQPLFGNWAEDPEIGPGLEVLHSKGLIDYDDDFVDIEGTPSTMEDQAAPGPATGVDTGVASMLMDAIKDEWSTIDKYNSILATVKATPEIDPTPYETVLNHINEEELKHVGELQELLKQIAPNTQEIAKGQQEAKSELKFVDGKLQVEFWDNTPGANSQTPFNEVGDLCTIDDIDDEM